MINNQKLRDSLPFKFILFSLLICTAIFVVENINGKFFLNDLKVYYLAAEALISKQQVYGVPFGLSSGYYKYSPFTLLLFTPYTLFSFEVARVIHFIVLFLVIVSSIILVKHIITNYLFKEIEGNKELGLSLIFVCVLFHLVRELHMGNINIILVLLINLALLSILKSKYIYGGVLLALIIMTKPYFLILLLPLIAHKKIKTILVLLSSIIIFVALPSLFLGIEKNIALHQSWIDSMLQHNASLTSNQTIQSLIKYYVYSDLPARFQYYIIAFVGFLYSAFFLLYKRFERRNKIEQASKNRRLTIEFFILMAIVPNLVITDTEHFLLSLPIIAAILSYLFIKRNYKLLISFIIIVFFYAGNSPDLLGRGLSDLFHQMGLLGLSNIILIIMMMYLTNQSRKEFVSSKKGD